MMMMMMVVVVVKRMMIWPSSLLSFWSRFEHSPLLMCNALRTLTHAHTWTHTSKMWSWTYRISSCSLFFLFHYCINPINKFIVYWLLYIPVDDVLWNLCNVVGRSATWSLLTIHLLLLTNRILYSIYKKFID